MLRSDHLDLEFQLHARLLRHRLAYVVDDLEDVARRRASRVDDVVPVQRRDLGAADRETLETAFIDEHARRARTAGILEHRAAARLIKRRTRLAPPEQAGLQLLQLRRRLL